VGESIAGLEFASVGFVPSIFDWVVPGLTLTVPGLLVISAVFAQAAGGLTWMPLVVRVLSGLGLGRRRESGLARDRGT
jgi:hypothetical protein